MTISPQIVEKYMQIALQESAAAFKRGDGPIGAVIIDLKGKNIVAVGSNQQNTSYDPTAHAEITAIRQACLSRKSPYLKDCALIVTTEPCTMCISAIIKAQIPEVYYGVSIKELIDNGFSLMPMSAEEIAIKSPYPISVIGNILAKKCLAQRLEFKQQTS